MSTAQELEALIKSSKESIKTSDAIKRLKKNKDFKLVFTDDFFRDHAIDCVRGKAEPAMQTPRDQSYFDGQIAAIGHLEQFLNIGLALGTQAETALPGHEAELHAYQTGEYLEEGGEE